MQQDAPHKDKIGTHLVVTEFVHALGQPGEEEEMDEEEDERDEAGAIHL
jgi:hypothetical protein